MTSLIQQQIFIGVSVNPKNGKPVFVQKIPGFYRTAKVYACVLDTGAAPRAGRSPTDYVAIGEGYLDECSSSYSRFAKLVGYPRCHTPAGIAPHHQGAGWGLSLYVGLAMMATGESRKLYSLFGLCGSGEGIHSVQGDRSAQAARWWERAIRSGMVTSEDVASEDADPVYDEETDTIEWRHLSSSMRGAIIETMSSRFDFERIDDATFEIVKQVEVESDDDSGTADVLTFDACWKHNLIALFDPREGSWENWGKLTPLEADAAEYDKDVIVALNLMDEDEDVTRWFIDLAKQTGATGAEIEGMRVRTDFGVDPSGQTPAPALEVTGEPAEKLAKRNAQVLLEAASVARGIGDDAAAASLESIVAAGGVRDNHLLDQIMKNPGRQRDHRRHRQRRRMVRNPAGSEREIERALRDVEAKRAKLGWADLADL